MNRVLVSVPASSANLGPGFDTLGLCLEKRNVFVFEKQKASFTFEGVEPCYCNEDNLAVVAFKRANEYLEIPETGFHLILKKNEVPVSRGLGSSSTFILAGILAANAFADYVLKAEEILMLATEVEGHPDNVCAALFGGLTMALTEEGQAYYAKVLPDSSLRFTVFIPDCKLETEQARKVLPKEYSREDAVYNTQHALLLIQALQTGNPALIKASLKDRIHVPYRRSLIPEYDLIERAAYKAGALAVTISGAGPSVLAISKGSLKRAALINELQESIRIPWSVQELAVSEGGSFVEKA